MCGSVFMVRVMVRLRVQLMVILWFPLELGSVFSVRLRVKFRFTVTVIFWRG